MEKEKNSILNFFSAGLSGRPLHLSSLLIALLWCSRMNIYNNNNNKSSKFLATIPVIHHSIGFERNQSAFRQSSLLLFIFLFAVTMREIRVQ
jgi:hypothetical protein